jgi:hypothetical protein
MRILNSQEIDATPHVIKSSPLTWCARHRTWLRSHRSSDESPLGREPRQEWLVNNGLERSVSQQLTTIAVILAPFVSGSAFMELLGTLA